MVTPYFSQIDKGIDQADAGKVISQAEARQRMAKWLKYGGHRRPWNEWGALIAECGFSIESGCVF